jgi:hypothetical protein
MSNGFPGYAPATEVSKSAVPKMSENASILWKL